jgi:integrase
MANLRKRGKFFGAQFRIPKLDGSSRLVSVSTKATDVNEARRFAQSAEQMALKAASVDKIHGTEYCEILLQAIRDAGASRLTEAKAREHLSRISEIARGKPLKSYTVRDWFAEYLRQKKPNVAASTLKAYEWGYDSFIGFLGPRADAGIENIEHADVRAWRDAQKESGLSDKRVNNLLKYISGPFAKAAKTGMIPINPVAATESLRVSDSIQRKPFTIEEVNLLLSKCPSKEWRVVMLLGVYCGMRLGDASKRRMGEFDLEDGTVTNGTGLSRISLKINRRKADPGTVRECDQTTFPDRLSAHRFCHCQAPFASRDPAVLRHHHPTFAERIRCAFRRRSAGRFPQLHRSNPAPTQLRPPAGLLGVARPDPRSKRLLPEGRRTPPKLVPHL